MRPILFSVWKINIYGYGTMIAIGIILCFIFAMRRAKKYGFDPDTLFNGGIFGIVSGILGAKITYWIVHIKEVINDPSMLLDIGDGFVVYGGLAIGIFVGFLYVKYIKKQRFLAIMDFALPSIPLAHAFGRLGCFMAGCCHGIEAPEGAWYAIVFPADSMAPAGVPLVPVQPLSAALLLLLFAFLWFMTDRYKFAGEGLSIYAILYSVGRFLIEFIRDDDRGAIGSLSTSQFLAIFVFAAGIILFMLFRKLGYSPVKRVTAEKPSDLSEDNEAGEVKDTEEDKKPEEAEDTEEEN